MMHSLIGLSVILASAVAASALNPRLHPTFNNGRIVGGSDAPDGQNPYQVSVQQFGFHYCAGSIISPEWILTAAHCVINYQATVYSILVGTNKLSQGGTTFLDIHYHEDYDNKNIKNDVAVVKVEPITYNEKVQPIVLETEEVGGDESCVLSGWGMLHFPTRPSPDKLQHIQLQTTSFDLCKSSHTHPVAENEICTLTKLAK